MKTSFHCTPTMKTVPLILNIIFAKNLLWKIWKLSECIGFLISMQTKYAHVHTYIINIKDDASEDYSMMLHLLGCSNLWKMEGIYATPGAILHFDNVIFIISLTLACRHEMMSAVSARAYIFEILLPEINTCISTPSSFANCKPKF